MTACVARRAIVCLACVAQFDVGALAAPRAPFLRGVALGLFGTQPTHPYEHALREIRALGATHVLFPVQWWMPHARASSLGPVAEKTFPDDRLRALLTLARRLGLRAFLVPLVGLRRRRPLEWRGVVAPADALAFRRAYTRFILHYARIAAEERVSMLALGSELSSLDGDAGYFRALARRVRRVFRGALTYAVNWDRMRRVAFWDALDAIAISAYFEVGRGLPRPPPPDKLAARWAEIRADLRAFVSSLRSPRPLLFAEAGYPSRVGGCARPWNASLASPVSIAEQHLCYRALREAWQNEPMLSGVFFWIWWGEGGAHDGGYTPRGKPALDEVRAWFGASPAAGAHK